MRKIIYIFFFTFILTMELTVGKNGDKTRNAKISQKTLVTTKFNNRLKRSPGDSENLLWIKNKKILDDDSIGTRLDDIDENSKYKDFKNMEKEFPFWGSRGRRGSSSVENYVDNSMSPEMKFYDKLCKNCYSDSGLIQYTKERREESESPFWGSRGRRNSDEIIFSASLGNAVKTHEQFSDSQEQKLNDGFALWNRGTQQSTLLDSNQATSDYTPFWGNRGRRDETEPFWGSRGRREETEPFWGSRGRREDSEPFWGSRGRREEYEPFWGSRGRREESEPVWGSLGRREENEPFWGNRGGRLKPEFYMGRHEEKTSNPHDDYQENLKQSIKNAIKTVENKIDKLSRLRRSENSFWNNRGRSSQLNFLLNNARNRLLLPYNKLKTGHSSMKFKPFESSTVLDDRVYAEQPSYIVVERSSRSSGEDDPYFISRGKKKIHDFEIAQAVRDRRGVIEELVKTVQNDPYFIARGKKDSDIAKFGNISSYTDLTRTKEFICSTIDLILNKNKESKVKRELPDNERDRRTILKKLAAQLQMDPYFVSRGKRSGINNGNEDNLHDFVREIIQKCY